MSGGAIGTSAYQIESIIDGIKEALREDKEQGVEHEKQALEIIDVGIDMLRISYVFAQRIDYYLAGDDGHESFIRRVQEDILALKVKSE